MKRIASCLSILLLLVKITASVMAAEIVYEPFDYASGTLNGTQTNGVGFATNSWSTSTSDGGILYSMVSGALSFTDLPTQGGVRAKRASAAKGGEMNRPISAASQAALTADNTTIWFSVLLQDERFSFGNESGTFALGSAPLDAGASDNVLPTIAGGEAFGVVIRGITAGIRAFQVDDGSSTQSATQTNLAASTATWLIAGKIEWNPNGSNDILRTFNITNALAGEPKDADAFATMTADLDQSQFDTIAIANRQVSSVDEIRFGLDYYSVTGREAPPPQGTLILIR